MIVKLSHIWIVFCRFWRSIALRISEHFCANCHSIIDATSTNCPKCGALTFVIDQKRTQLLEEKVCRDLIKYAVSVVGQRRPYTSLSAMTQAIQQFTNKLYMGRVYVLGIKVIAFPFPRVWEVREKILEVFTEQYMLEDSVPPLVWQEAWNRDVIPDLHAIGDYLFTRN